MSSIIDKQILNYFIMRSFNYILLLLVLLPAGALAQIKPEVIPLWKNGAPGFENLKEIPEQSQDWWVKSINNPSLTLFRPPADIANDDEYGCDEVTFELLQKFREAKVPVEVFFLTRGKHAFNMGDRSSYTAVRNWPQRMADWLNDSGYLKH
ncbi:MAG: hypothetical protein A2X04_14230 [Bacteroidetes bacterium GWF2_41_9]|nr:MAG: hypothetical protein A2X04_14230 [Bacteroidetes bacterium GWF2_41_9]